MECGLQHMNKHIFYLTFIVTILLTGCADMGTETPTEETVAAKISEDNAETLPLKLPEWMPIYHDNSETTRGYSNTYIADITRTTAEDIGWILKAERAALLRKMEAILQFPINLVRSCRKISSSVSTR